MPVRERITIHDVAEEVRVTVGGITLAQSRAALRLDETGHAPVFYLPPGDVDMTRLTESERHSHCPYKGDASYYTLKLDDMSVPDIAWSYRRPIDSVARIANHIAFYRDKCEIKASEQ